MVGFTSGAWKWHCSCLLTLVTAGGFTALFLKHAAAAAAAAAATGDNWGMGLRTGSLGSVAVLGVIVGSWEAGGAVVVRADDPRRL